MFCRDGIKKTVRTRIDLEHFLAKISNVSKAEEFTNAVKSTQVNETVFIQTIVEEKSAILLYFDS